MMTPDDIDVWVGLDVGKSAHHAHALDHDGNTLYDKPLKQDEKAIRTMLGKLSKHGRVLLVVDQPNTIGSLPLTVARNMGIAVAYLPGTAMRRTAQLLPGDAKTDRRDAHVIAWAALKLPETLRDVYGQINVYGVTTKSERHKRSYWTRTADGNGIGGRKAPVPYGS